MKETSHDRKKRFKRMSSEERQLLIREKMRMEGLEEGSGVKRSQASNYAEDEIRELIEITSCFPELKKNSNRRI